MGRRRGLPLGEAMAREPEAVGGAWLTDPRATPHGGESLPDFVRRVGGWLDTRPAPGGRLRGGGRGRAGRDPRGPGARAAGTAGDVLEHRRPPAADDPCGRPGRWSLCLDGVSAQPVRA
ncbi:hypothetical protein GCM10010266_25210 [Streptomyces griseomycini]|nr:hypothetical protein GCM10010266_25210 [Streptomyces griseomycini]